MTWSVADIRATDVHDSGDDAPIDAGDDAPEPDANVDACMPPYGCESCCGPAPDGCGGVLACAGCRDDIWCAPSRARFDRQVREAVQSVMDSRPQLFDPVMFRDTSSWLVIDDEGYTSAVVAACNASGLVCIADPNDHHELRVRAPSERLAENHAVRVRSSNRTRYRFMGGICETTLF